MKAMRIILLVLVSFTMVGCFNFEGNIPDPPDIDIRVNQDTESSSGPGMVDDVGDNASTSRTLGAENGVLFYAFDILAYPMEERSLVVHLRNARPLRGLGGVTITFYQLGKPIGNAVTDRNGVAQVSVRPRDPGDYMFTAEITAVPANVADNLLEVSPAPLLLVARPPEADFLVVDVDHTLVSTGLTDVLAGEDPRPMDDAADVLNRIAGTRGSTVIYLTATPEQSSGRLKRWLRDHGFPAGPVLVLDPDAAEDPFSRNGASLSGLRNAYPGVSRGIADKISAARAFLDNEMSAILLPHYQVDPHEMRDLAERIEDLPDSPWLSVVNSWRDIEVAILHELRFSPENYADRLDKLADEIEDQRRRDRRRNRQDN